MDAAHAILSARQCGQETVADEDVYSLIDDLGLVIEYRERIGIESRALSKQFDGFSAPQYTGMTWTVPAEAQDRWAAVRNGKRVNDARYKLCTVGDYLLCEISATLTPKTDIDPATGERYQDAYGLREGDVHITGILSPDADIPGYPSR